MDPRSEASYSSTDTCENEPDNLPLPDDATIPDLMNHLGSTEWYEFTSNLLQETVGDRSVKAMVCLGIGSMEKHRASRIQFAVAMLLADHFGIERSSVMVYDPVMTQDDEDVVRTLGYRVGRNELDFRPTRKSDEAVLLYMPKIPIFVVTDVLSHIKIDFLNRGAGRYCRPVLNNCNIIRRIHLVGDFLSLNQFQLDVLNIQLN